MSAIPQQITAGQKSAVESIVNVQQSLFSGFEKLVELNLKTVRASLDEAAQAAHRAFDLKDPQQTAGFVSGLAQPAADKALAYSRQVYDIIASVQAELTRQAETRVVEQQRFLSEAVDQLGKNAPAGSEHAQALLKSSLASFNGAYDTLSKAAKQAAEVAEKNVHAAANASFQAASEAAGAAAKAGKVA